MARIAGKERPGFFGRIVYWIARRRFGRVPEPLRITAHNPWVFAAANAAEGLLEKAHAVDLRSKELVSILVALRIGCPF
jgi:alkylhydroperoxidase family enzyme